MRTLYRKKVLQQGRDFGAGSKLRKITEHKGEGNWEPKSSQHQPRRVMTASDSDGTVILRNGYLRFNNDYSLVNQGCFSKQLTHDNLVTFTETMFYFASRGNVHGNYSGLNTNSNTWIQDRDRQFQRRVGNFVDTLVGIWRNFQTYNAFGEGGKSMTKKEFRTEVLAYVVQHWGSRKADAKTARMYTDAFFKFYRNLVEWQTIFKTVRDEHVNTYAASLNSVASQKALTIKLKGKLSATSTRLRNATRNLTTGPDKSSLNVMSTLSHYIKGKLRKAGITNFEFHLPHPIVKNTTWEKEEPESVDRDLTAHLPTGAELRRIF